MIAAMSVSLPTPRYTPAIGKKIMTELAETVGELEAKLGANSGQPSEPRTGRARG